MGFFSKKARELEANQDISENIAKVSSDTAVDTIKKLSGVDNFDSVRSVDNVIVFTNAAGGAGATTVAGNFAVQAFQRKLNVVLIDLNVMCPSQYAYFDIKQVMDKPDLVSYLLGKNKLSDSINTEKKISLIFANNRTLMDEINCNDKSSVANLPTMISNLRQYYDLVVVDCPMRPDVLLYNTMLYIADSIYMVWDEGISSIINTEKLRRNMALSGIDSFTKMRIIMNKKTSVKFSSYPLQKLNLELIGTLPFDVDIIDNSLRGRIFCESGESNSKNAIEFAHQMEVISDKILKTGGFFV